MRSAAVIGAGPAGTYCAMALAREGWKVTVYEEHESVGDPIQCTGIVTQPARRLIHIPERIVANTIGEVSIGSARGGRGPRATIRLKEKDIILFRNAFDRHLAAEAERIGVVILHAHRFLRYDKGVAYFRTPQGEKTIEADELVGADGVNSKVRGLLNERPIVKYAGVQAVLTAGPEGAGKDVEHRYDTLFSAELDNSFGWIVPEGRDRFRVGIGVLSHAKEKFDRFMETTAAADLRERGYTSWRIIGWQGGFIPLYDPDLVVRRGNISLAGDAATQVKATTLGGIILGMRGAAEIASHIVRGGGGTVRNRDLSVHRELQVHLTLRRMLDHAAPRDLDAVVRLLDAPPVRRLVETVPRDELGGNVMRTARVIASALARPSLWPPAMRMLRLRLAALLQREVPT